MAAAAPLEARSVIASTGVMGVASTSMAFADTLLMKRHQIGPFAAVVSATIATAKSKQQTPHQRKITAAVMKKT